MPKDLEKHENSVICSTAHTKIQCSPICVSLQLNVNFHEILFISSDDIVRRKKANFHPHSLKHYKNATYWMVHTKMYLRYISVRLQLKIKFHGRQPNRSRDMFITRHSPMKFYYWVYWQSCGSCNWFSTIYFIEMEHKNKKKNYGVAFTQLSLILHYSRKILYY